MVAGLATWEENMATRAKKQTEGPDNVTPIKKPPKHAGESKEGAFRRLGKDRFQKAVMRIRSLSYLANRGSYDYNEGQVETMISRLREEVDALEMAFQAALTKGQKNIDIDI